MFVSRSPYLVWQAATLVNDRSQPRNVVQWNANRIGLAVVAAFSVFYAVLAVRFTLVPTGDGLRNASGGVIGNDFLFFYTASKVLLAGDAAMVFDQTRFFALQQQIGGQPIQFPWAYPPHFLIFLAPLAWMPFIPALFVWLTATTAPFVFIIRRYSALPLLTIPFLPPIVHNLISGQNGALTASLAAGGMAALAVRRSWLAGILFGCLAYKPQTFVLAPICLLACRDLRAFGGLMITATGLPLLALAAFGTDIWASFFEQLPRQMSYVTSGRMPTDRFATVFIFLFSATGDETLARVGQAISTMAALTLVYACWRRSKDFYARALAFCVALPLATPYLYEYDFALWSLPAALLATKLWRGEAGGVQWIALIVLMWLPPVIFWSSLAGLNYSVLGVLALVPFAFAAAPRVVPGTV